VGVSASAKGITTFTRAAFSPPDRNLIDFYADSGIAFNRLIPARPEDRFGVAAAYMHVSKEVRLLIRTWNMSPGNPFPSAPSKWCPRQFMRPTSNRGWLLQPFFQYIFRPGEVFKIHRISLAKLRELAMPRYLD
jgi:porin